MRDGPEPPVLEVRDLAAGYGSKPVLHSVSLTAAAGDLVVVLGHNGAGKSTLLRTIFGLLPRWRGEVRVVGRSTSGKPRELIALGVGLVLQGGRVFTELTVRENLNVVGRVLGGRGEMEAALQRVLEVFPTLELLLRRPAATLSGGERQIVALASGLIPSPRLLLLDEPSLGLAPALVTMIFERLQEIARNGVAIVMVEQRVREALRYAGRACVIRNGLVAYEGPTSDLRDEAELRRIYL